MTTLEQFNLAENELANIHRIKKGVDYALAFKYGELHVLCQELYEDTVREVLNRHGIDIKSMHKFT